MIKCRYSGQPEGTSGLLYEELPNPQLAFINVPLTENTPGSEDLTYYRDMTCTWTWQTNAECKAYVYFPICSMEGGGRCHDHVDIAYGAVSERQMCGGDLSLGETISANETISGSFVSDGENDGSGCSGVLLVMNCPSQG